MIPAFSDIRMHHFSIAVPDLDHAIDWWSDVFGFAVARRMEIAPLNMRGAFVQRDGLRVELWCRDGAKPVPEERKSPNTDLLTNGTKHIAFCVADVPAAIAQLEAKGVEIAMIQRGFGEPMADKAAQAERPAVAAFIRDPFGTLIEIIADTAPVS
jgi:methylmalonyl-CoA/ethylmalonyl-CoA epimerase